MQNKREIGANNEQAAGEYLKKKGYEILAYNVYSEHNELDIVARHGAYLVFVEVKYRSKPSYGHPMEAVNQKKQKHICKGALAYIQKNGLESLPVRFDVVAIVGEQVEVIQNAFDFSM